MALSFVTSPAGAQFEPKIDIVLLGQPNSNRVLSESPRWLEDGASAVAPIIEGGSPAFAMFDGGATPTLLVESGDIAYTDGAGQFWIFGARLDAGGSIISSASRVFRGAAANGDFVAFYAGLVEEGTGLIPAPLATKIGVFKLDVSTGVLTALAIDGEPVSDFTTDPFFPGATWRLKHYTENDLPDSLVVPARYEPRLGKSSGVALNASGQAAFRLAADLVGESNPSRGVIFAEDATGVLRFVAIENDLDQGTFDSNLVGVGSVTPQILGRPVINSAGNITFYAETLYGSSQSAGTGVFFWDGGQDPKTVMHSGMEQQAATGVARVELAPPNLKSTSVGVEGGIFIDFTDQPDINCADQVVFRASAEEVVPGPSAESVWVWTNDGANNGLGSYERIFTSGDQLPGGGGTISDEPFKTGLGASDAFGRPMINGLGEVAVSCGVDPPGSGNSEKAILSMDQTGAKRTVVLTNSASHVYTDGIGVVRQVTEIGPLDPLNSLGRYYDISLNECGQIAFAANHVNGTGYGAFFYIHSIGIAPAVHTGLNLLPPGGFGAVPIPSDGLIFGAGSGQDGDSVLTDNGDLLWGRVIQDVPNGLYDRSPKIFATALPPMTPCLADLNGDNVVDTADLGLLTSQFGDPCPCSGDFNGDGVVDTADLGIMIGVFGMNCRGCFAGAAEAQGSPTSLMVKTGVPLFTEFGFTDPNVYREWFNSLTETERGAHLQDAVEVIQLAP